MKIRKMLALLLIAVVTAVAFAVPASAAKIAAPTDMVVSVKSETSVLLKWDKVSGAKKYQVYYSTTEEKNYKLYKTTTKTSITIKKLKTDTRYYFKLRSIDKNGKKSKYSRAVSGVPSKIENADVELTAIETVLCKDYKGDDFLRVTYKFKQNTKEAKSFSYLVTDDAYQNGIQLDRAYVSDYLDDSASTKIMPGVEFEVQRGYKIRDLENDIVIYCKRFLKDNIILSLTVTM